MPDPTTETPEQPAPAAATDPLTFTPAQQAHIDSIVRDRLERQKRAVEAQAASAKEAAEAERLKAAQEWQKVAEQKEAALVQARAELASERLAMARARVAAKHGLPEALAKRLVGTTEDELDLDAKDMAAVLTPSTPAAEPGNPEGPSKARGYGPRAGVAAPATGNDPAMPVGVRAQPGNVAGPAPFGGDQQTRVEAERARLIATKKYSGLA